MYSIQWEYVASSECSLRFNSLPTSKAEAKQN